MAEFSGYPYRFLKIPLISTLILLLIPLGLTLTNPDAALRGGPGGGFDWMPGDFLIMGMMIFVAMVGLQMLRISRLNQSLKCVLAGLIIALFLALWVELAVGFFSKTVGL